MLATMIPISGDPWCIRIDRVVPEMCVADRNDSPIDYSPSSAIVLRDIVVYKLIDDRKTIYKEQ